jgi:hypothetical protein
MRNQRHLFWLFLLCAPACASGASTSANLTRSPTLDYPPPPAETSDGQVVGADGIRPEHKLTMSPQLGTAGMTPAARPPAVEDPSAEPPGITEDPLCDGLGMRDKVRKARCNKAAQPTPKR